MIKIVAGFLALVFIVITLCIIFGITISLKFLKPGVETSARLALGREVKINGLVVF